MEAAFDLNEALRAIVAKAVDERIGEVSAREDAMARVHGEYVKIKDAARILNCSVFTVNKLRAEGILEDSPVGISVRSMANLTEEKKKQPRRRPNERFERIRP